MLFSEDRLSNSDGMPPVFVDIDRICAPIGMPLRAVPGLLNYPISEVATLLMAAAESTAC